MKFAEMVAWIAGGVVAVFLILIVLFLVVTTLCIIMSFYGAIAGALLWLVSWIWASIFSLWVPI